ncbi:hypothetical protein [Myroides odoratimimus]|uniref:hypothetical protein n=1 Tax=Myroides odoratimimus TaxID=76832 RepID=UPI002575C247|nr:hypothetical protein [Myroides odoratimimus]MDM1453894.1 hypothetical protein [Myroides odoratimimus]MDM1477616.1 hypothetical protein [Myroides odoratimimus]MDM1490020.1 hypothetical protein [Myroides odoratimimus]
MDIKFFAPFLNYIFYDKLNINYKSLDKQELSPRFFSALAQIEKNKPSLYILEKVDLAFKQLEKEKIQDDMYLYLSTKVDIVLESFFIKIAFQNEVNKYDLESEQINALQTHRNFLAYTFFSMIILQFNYQKNTLTIQEYLIVLQQAQNHKTMWE